MASIEKRSENTYRITVSAGYDSKGVKKRKHKTVSIPATMTERQREKELQRLAVLFESEVEKGAYLDGAKISFEEFISKWLADHAEKQLTPSTIKSYKSKIENRIIPSLGHLKMSKIQPHHLLEFYNNLEEDGVRLDTYYKATDKLLNLIDGFKSTDLGIDNKTLLNLKKGNKVKFSTAEKISKHIDEKFSLIFVPINKNATLSSKTIKQYHDLISSIFTTAVQWNVIFNNPADRVKPPKVAKKQGKYYDEEQVAKLLMNLEDEPLTLKTIVYLAIDTGLRVGELCALTWNDIDYDKKSIKVDKQRQYVHNYGVITTIPKTESGVRHITVSDIVIKLLKKYKLEQDKNRIRLANIWISSDLIFVHEDGSPIHPHRPYKWFTDFLKKHEMPIITFHALRHTNASILIAQGIDIVTLSGRLGHSDKNVTLNVYSHIISAKEKQAANKMNDFYNKIL